MSDVAWIFLEKRGWEWEVVGRAISHDGDIDIEIFRRGAKPEWALAVPGWLPVTGVLKAWAAGLDSVTVASPSDGWETSGRVVPTSRLWVEKVEGETVDRLQIFGGRGALLSNASECAGVAAAFRLSGIRAVSTDEMAILRSRGVLDVYPMARSRMLVPIFPIRYIQMWGMIAIGAWISPEAGGVLRVSVRPALEIRVDRRTPYHELLYLLLVEVLGNGKHPPVRRGLLRLRVGVDGRLRSCGHPVSAFVVRTADVYIIEERGAVQPPHHRSASS